MSAYFVFHNRILDAEKMQEYVPKALETLAPYHPEVVTLDEHSRIVEGHTPWPRTIVIKFDSRDAAMAWYDSPDNAEARAVTPAAFIGRVLMLVEGTQTPK